jgi:hypothetical protein
MSYNEYSDVMVIIDNVSIIDAQSISLSYEHNDTEIHNLEEGFAGISKGTSIMRINVDTAVQRIGPPLNISKLANDRTAVEITIFVGDQSLTSNGYIKNPTVNGSIDSPVSMSFEFYGKPQNLV